LAALALFSNLRYNPIVDFIIILNPVAGKGKGARDRPLIERYFKKRSVSFKVLETTGPGNAITLVHDYPFTPDDIVVAAGGDGTCNEVVNGLLTRQDRNALPRFAVLPVGRGNDFSYNCGMGDNLEAALDILCKGKAGPLDAGRVTGGNFPNGRFFINGVGIGFDAKVGFAAAKLKLQSGITYALGALITIAQFEQSPTLEIQYGNRPETGGKLETVTDPLAIVSIMNGRRMGGIFMMAPKAEIDDGAFDICSIRHPKSRRRLIYLVSKYPHGKQIYQKETFTSRAEFFHIKALEGSMAAHCDGETVCTEGKELTMECLPHALMLIRPDAAGK
jgi:YegS/Rv2252/BmrU family lipid kinase